MTLILLFFKLFRKNDFFFSCFLTDRQLVSVSVFVCRTEAQKINDLTGKLRCAVDDKKTDIYAMSLQCLENPVYVACYWVYFY